MLRMTWKKSILFALLPLALAAQAACGGGGASAPGDPTGLILDGAGPVAIINVKSFLEATALPAVLTGDEEEYQDAQDGWRDEWDDSDYAFDTNPDNVTTFITVQGRYYYEIVRGDFDFPSIKNYLEDEDFEEGSYRNQPIWEKDNGESAALFEGVNTYVYGASDTVKEVLKAIDRGTGFINADSDMKRAMDAADSGLISNAKEDCDFIFLVGSLGNALNGCDAYAMTVTGGDDDESKITVAFVFSSERRAESGMEDIQDQIHGNSDIDADVDEIDVSGTVVTAKITVYEE